MKNRADKKGYIKVADDFMLSELLHSITRPQLLSVHVDELQRIQTRLDRTNYISLPQRDYLTELYTDVVLNGKTFKITPKIKQYTQKRGEFQHIGMQMYHSLNSINSQQGESFGTVFGR